jgi:outer membrane protein assembly factor BamB
LIACGFGALGFASYFNRRARLSPEQQVNTNTGIFLMNIRKAWFLSRLLASIILLSTITLAQNGTFDTALISPQATTRSGLITISGSGFGTKRNGNVLIGGQRAFTTAWTNTQIAAYVPESAALGQNAVEIVTGGVSIPVHGVTVEPRPAAQPTAQGKVAWRFEVLANYLSHRADVARDGTVYFNDSSGFLYALTPEGSLKWIYDSQALGSQGPTVIGRDGTIYFGVSAPSGIHAVNPDGTLKWIFPATQSQGPIGGPGIGPDGNIYAVFDLPGPIGAVSLTPAGTLRWNTAGNPRVAEYGQVGRELVFGGGNVYFTSTYYGDVYAFDLTTGGQRFRVNVGSAGQAAATKNGTVLVPTELAPRLNVYSRTGVLRWSFFGDEHNTTNDLSAPDVGRDGNIYIDRNLSELYSLTPTPSVRWIVDSLLPQGPVPGPIVGPMNDVVLIGGQQTYGRPGLIQAFSTVDGALLFQISIPKEPDGTCAVPYARPRFNRSGDRAYIPAVQLCVVPQQYHSWLYAIDITTP